MEFSFIILLFTFFFYFSIGGSTKLIESGGKERFVSFLSFQLFIPEGSESLGLKQFFYVFVCVLSCSCLVLRCSTMVEGRKTRVSAPPPSEASSCPFLHFLVFSFVCSNCA